MYLRRTSTGPVELAFTDRHGGVSRPPFESLNLAISGEDDPRSRAINTALVVADFAPGAAMADMVQVHGGDVVCVSTPGRSTCDALITAETDVVLVTRVADCVPVLLADPEHGVIGAAHAGRPGVVAGVITNTVAAMRELGADIITAWVGPHVCGGCYEVPDDMRAAVSAVEPTTFAQTRWGTPALDIGAGVRAQLQRAEVEVVSWEQCTMESSDLYSHRRDGAGAGRSAGLIWRRS